jgi:hypothetical protein
VEEFYEQCDPGEFSQSLAMLILTFGGDSNLGADCAEPCFYPCLLSLPRRYLIALVVLDLVAAGTDLVRLADSARDR